MNKNTGNTAYLMLTKSWLVGILTILPFQLKVAAYAAQWNSKLYGIVNNLDEITVVLLLLPAIGEFYRQRGLPHKVFFFYSSH